MYRTGLILAACCFALWRGALWTLDDEACEYEEILQVVDTPVGPGLTLADQLAALEGPFFGVWRQRTDDDFELPARARFVPDLGTLRSVEPVGEFQAHCGEATIRVDGILAFTDERGNAILDIPVMVERDPDDHSEWSASPHFSPTAGRIRWTEGGLEAELSRIDLDEGGAEFR